MIKFLINLWNKIKVMFGALPAELKKAIHIGVLVTEAVKTFVDSPAADALTAIIPGTVDDKVKQILRTGLPKLLIQLRLVEAMTESDDPAVITAKAVEVLQAMNGNIKRAYLHNLSILVAQLAADGELTWKDGAYILEWYYQQQYKAA